MPRQSRLKNPPAGAREAQQANLIKAAKKALELLWLAPEDNVAVGHNRLVLAPPPDNVAIGKDVLNLYRLSHS